MKIESKRLNVWVLMGGPSSESEVSKVSGSGMVRALDPERFAVVPVVISKTFEWKWTEKPLAPAEQKRVIEYLEGLPLNREVEVGGERYLLVHGSPEATYMPGEPE
ncbi:MAG: hypothetical protein J6V65_04135, partial [Fibrobacterales bacterium]|nr:hypothetical protein [Fibrobacterales bacterium]